MSACSLLFAHNKIRWCMFLAWYHIFFQLRFCDHRRKQDRTNSSLTPSQTILTALHSSISWQRITTDHKTWRGPGVSNRTFGHRTKSSVSLGSMAKLYRTHQKMWFWLKEKNHLITDLFARTLLACTLSLTYNAHHHLISSRQEAHKAVTFLTQPSLSCSAVWPSSRPWTLWCPPQCCHPVILSLSPVYVS